MVLFVIAVCYDLCTTFRTVLKRVCLVYKQPVYAQLLKGPYKSPAKPAGVFPWAPAGQCTT